MKAGDHLGGSYRSPCDRCFLISGSSSGGCKTSSISGSVLKVKTIGFDNGLGSRGEREVGRMTLRFMARAARRLS